MVRGIGGGGLPTVLASIVALLFSAVSLYQTVLKQPDLQIYASPMAHYTADNEAGAEVFAVPITVANKGARTGTVLALELDVTNVENGEKRSYYSAYQVDGDYFIGSAEYDWQSKRMKKSVRPKAPFSPISVAGQSAYSGTLLFYPASFYKGKLVSEKGKFVLTLRPKTKFDDDLGFGLFAPSSPKEIALNVTLPYYNRYTPMQGGTLPLIGSDILPHVKGRDGAQEQPNRAE